MKKYFLLFIFVSLSAIAGCHKVNPPELPRGALVEKADFDQLVIGKTTKKDVVDAIGSPTAHATFNDNIWIYTTLVKSMVPLNFPKITKQQIVVLQFNPSNTLENVKILSKKDSVKTKMAEGATPAPGTKISVIQEILGNVGRYNPMSSMGNTFGGGLGGMGNGMGGPMSGQGTGNGGVGNTVQ